MGREISIDLGALFRVLWKEKWRIILITTVVTALGVAYAFIIREEFVTEGKILPELQGKASGLSQFSGLASLAGIDLNSIASGPGIDAVRPDLYPDVIASTPFYLELFKIKVHTKEKEELTFDEYYHRVIEKGKKPEGKMLVKYTVQKEGIIPINLLYEERLKILRKRVTAVIDKKSGVITISSKMPDPVVAAEVTRFAMEYLIEYVKDYRTKKLKQDMDYLGEQVASSRGKYYYTQERKARYTDQSQAIRLQSADVQRERIESEYRLSSSVYSELLKKYEEAKFRLYQETPIFQILEPPFIHTKKTEPKRGVIGAIAIIIGGCIGTMYALFVRKNYKSVFLKNTIE